MSRGSQAGGTAIDRVVADRGAIRGQGNLLEALEQLPSPIPAAILTAAAELDPAELRSLDALHLASALSLGEDLARFYCYDARLAAAAEALGIEVSQPR